MILGAGGTVEQDLPCVRYLDREITRIRPDFAGGAEPWGNACLRRGSADIRCAYMKASPAGSRKDAGKLTSARLGKVFKSGNSTALRLPAGMRVPAGKTFALTPTASGFVAVDSADLARRRKALAALFGSAADFPRRES